MKQFPQLATRCESSLAKTPLSSHESHLIFRRIIFSLSSAAIFPHTQFNFFSFFSFINSTERWPEPLSKLPRCPHDVHPKSVHDSLMKRVFQWSARHLTKEEILTCYFQSAQNWMLIRLFVLFSERCRSRSSTHDALALILYRAELICHTFRFTISL